mmetsp:Transcript_17079/g.51027  ORF Transcript_17079/g.51027 Transcript_17079/m.51027 type:complete len:150 (-) Transcript_17079:974-1423(-)
MAAASIPTAAGSLRLAVCGLHLRGQPLNSQLTDLGARFVDTCKSAPCYKLYALSPPAVAAPPSKPAMVRVNTGGAAIALETYDLPLTSVGAFMTKVPPPLAIGSVLLEDGCTVKGFIGEPYVIEAGEGVEDITYLGGWLAYVERGTAPS